MTHSIPEPELTARRAQLAEYMAQDHGSRAHAWPAVEALDRGESVAGLLADWHSLYEAGHQVSCACRRCEWVRLGLLAAGEWRVIYG